MKRWLVAMWLVTTAFASGCKKEQPAADRKAPPAPPVTRDAAPEVKDAAPVVPARSAAVFFVVTGGFDEPAAGSDEATVVYPAALPIACWDAAGDAFRGDEGECLPLLPPRPALAMSDGSKVVADRKGLGQCEVASFSTPGLRLPARGEGSQDIGPPFATWSADGALRVQMGRALEEDQLTPAQRKSIAAAVAKRTHGKGGKPEIRDIAELEVDGDTAPDRFVSVSVAPPPAPAGEGEGEGEDAETLLYSRILLFHGAAPGVAVELEWVNFDDTSEKFTVDAAVDLDRDGLPELAITGSTERGEGTELVSLDGAELTSLGGWGCSD